MPLLSKWIRRVGIVILMLAMSILLIGCKGGHDPELVNTDWVLEALNGNPIVPGSIVTLDFKHGKVSGTTGCSSYSGTYTARTTGTIQITNLYYNLQECLDQVVEDQEEDFVEALSLAVTYEMINNRLFLYNGAGEQILVFSLQASGSKSSMMPIIKESK